MLFLQVLLALLFAVLLVGVLAYLSAGFLAAIPASLQPTTAKAKVVPDCSVPSDPSNLPGINGNVTGGVFRAPRIVIPQGMTLQLTSSLILVADNLLQVDGTITLDTNAGAIPTGRVVTVTLVSLNASVVVGQTGRVGVANTMAPSAPAVGSGAANALAVGLAGTNGGFVKILAPQGAIDIQGAVEGFGGGSGGAATATANPNVVNVPLQPVFGGKAAAAGGQGGAGGDVILCALDGIQLSWVRGGFGGEGGGAVATARNGQHAYAVGGPGNDGGDVLVHGLVPNMAVSNNGSLQGGPGREGGTVTATGGNGSALPGGGGNAESRGGDGGAGGTVRFNQCLVQPIGVVASHDGGNGGDANAFAGRGANGQLFGGSGGDSVATGGNGGASGANPQIPTPPAGNLVAGQVVGGGQAAGKGGDATAQNGGGGNGRVRGGSSGSATAQGGTGKTGTVPGAGTAPDAGPTGGTGAVRAPPVTSTGSP